MTFTEPRGTSGHPAVDLNQGYSELFIKGNDRTTDELLHFQVMLWELIQQNVTWSGCHASYYSVIRTVTMRKLH